MSLKEIFCQDKAISILQRGLAADKMPHAYIFAGAEGVGKFKTAREWAKVLLCKNPVAEDGFADSCGACQSCLSFEAGSHPDFNHIYKELLEFTEGNKDKKTPVDLAIIVIREFLIEKVSTRPTLSQRKVYVISEAERLNASSQNAMLKVLEEPPEACTIILLCTRMERLLPTTRSRCRTIRFSRIDTERIFDRLKAVGLDSKKAEYFAHLAGGSLGQGCRWAQLELAGANLYQIKKELLNSLSTYKLADSLDLAEQLLGKAKKIAEAWGELDEAVSKTDINRRAQKTIVQIIISALHDAMKLTITGPQGLINSDQPEQIKSIAEHFRPEQSAEKIADAYTTMHWIESSVNEKLIFEQLLLNLVVSDTMRV
ncbi:MAG: DNA polymerase III subunit delta' C-terminal domain-containing protein [Phycisphaerae bacterium]|nr:DNA polymerase III subunit delta' C-terminal domain-containing protein [Phycisphaerae bacterium]MDD5380209.1 DNA polymerase III subunit delta' C-terminal domain-containing protein [Phycisphaerae bacterium]